MAVLRELISRLVVDDKKATGTLKRHDKQIKKTKRSMLELNAGIELIQKGFGLLRTVVRGASRAFDFLVADIAKTGDELAKSAKRIGTTAASLNELQFAAQRSGASAGAVEKSMFRMGKALEDVRLRGTGPVADQFETLGIKVEQFQGLSPDEAFEQLAQVIADIEDPLKKAALAQDLFGRGGKELIPLFNEGAEGIRALREEARRLGVIDEETAVASEHFQDAMLDLRTAVQGARFEIGRELIPVVTDIVGKIKEWIIENKTLLRERVVDFVRRLVEWLQKAAKWIGEAGAAIGGWIESMGGLEKAIGFIVKALVVMKIATLAAAGPWGILAAAAAAAGAAIGIVLADMIGGVQDLKFELIDTEAELKRLERSRRIFERRGTLAEQETQALTALEAGAGTLSRAEFEQLEAQARQAGQRAGRGEATEATLAALRSRRQRRLREAAEAAAKGLTGRRRERVIAAARKRTLQLGGGTGAVRQAFEEARRGRGRPARAAGKGRGRAVGAAPAAPEAATDEELLALIEQAAPGVDLGGMAAGRGVPKAAAPIVTVTANVTNVDVDVDSPITIEGVAGMDAERLAEMVVERQGNVLDGAVREAIEALTPAAVGR